MKSADPCRMTRAERIDELAEILAAGIQRYFAQESKAGQAEKNSQDHLDVRGDFEAQCVANSKEPE